MPSAAAPPNFKASAKGLKSFEALPSASPNPPRPASGVLPPPVEFPLMPFNRCANRSNESSLMLIVSAIKKS